LSPNDFGLDPAMPADHLVLGFALVQKRDRERLSGVQDVRRLPSDEHPTDASESATASPLPKRMANNAAA
jgi:hypothetical protein